MHKRSQRVIGIALVLLGLFPLIGTAQNNEPTEQSSEAQGQEVQTPMPGGKGPGMGRQYQQNTPGPGQGAPEHRGVDAKEVVGTGEKTTSEKVGATAKPESSPRHRQHADPPLTPVEPQAGEKPLGLTNTSVRRALLHAAAFGDLEGVKKALNEGISPNARAKDKRGRTALILAAQGGHASVIEALLDRGARIEDRDKTGHTALNWAAMRGQIKSARVLLDRGADVNATNNGLVSPLLYAVGTRNQAMVKLLAAAGANMDVESRDNKMTPLLLAIEHHDIEMTRLLLQAGADINNCDREGFSPLMSAAAKANAELTSLLLQNGADPNLTDNKGRTALSLARKTGDEGTVQAVLIAGSGD